MEAEAVFSAEEEKEEETLSAERERRCVEAQDCQRGAAEKAAIVCAPFHSSPAAKRSRLEKWPFLSILSSSWRRVLPPPP